jgi:hypothetical protein
MTEIEEVLEVIADATLFCNWIIQKIEVVFPQHAANSLRAIRIGVYLHRAGI